MGSKLHPVLRYRRRLARKKIRQYDRQITHNQATAAGLRHNPESAANFRAVAESLKPYREEVAAEDRRLTKLIGS